jgi:hypothetical protein
LGIDQHRPEVAMHRRFSLDIPETLEDACDPAMMAVIVYDMQVGVLRQLPDGGAETVERVSRVLTAARDRPAMQRVLDDMRFAGDALLTDITAMTPLLSGRSTR